MEQRHSIIRGNDVIIRPAPSGEFMITINPDAEQVEAENKARAYCLKHPRQS